MRLARPSAQPRRSGEGCQHHPVPLQEVPAEEAEEREVDGKERPHGGRHAETLIHRILNKGVLLLLTLLG